MILSMQPKMKGARGHYEMGFYAQGVGEMKDVGVSRETVFDILADLETNFNDGKIMQRECLTDSENGTMCTASYGVSYERDDVKYMSELNNVQESREISWEEMEAKRQEYPFKRYSGNDFSPFFRCVPAGEKLLTNIAIYSGASFYKTETGFLLSTEIFGGKGVFEKALREGKEILQSIDIEKTALSALMEQKQASKILQTLLSGITAKEGLEAALFVTAAGSEREYERMKENIPDPNDGEMAFDYFKRLLNDKTFFKKMTDEDGMFGAMTVSDVLKEMFGVEATQKEIEQNWEEMQEELEANLIGALEKTLKDLLGCNDGEISDRKLLLNCLFNEDKKLDKIELVYDCKIGNSRKDDEFEGTIKVKAEFYPQENTVELQDLSGMKVDLGQRVKDCNLSTKYDLSLISNDGEKEFVIRDACTVTLIVADEKVTVKLESERFPELNFEKTVSLFSYETIEILQTMTADSCVKYLKEQGIEAGIDENGKIFYEEETDSGFSLKREFELPQVFCDLSVSKGSLYCSGSMWDTVEFFHLLEKVEYETVTGEIE